MNRTVALVAFAGLYPTIDHDEFTRRFPAVELVLEPYEVPHEVLVERTERPQQAAAGSETLTEAQRAAFARATAVLSLNLPLGLTTVAPELDWVQGIGSGVGHFVASGVEGVTVTNAAGVAAPPIAEWVVAQLLSIYKRLPVHQDQQRQRIWRSATGSLVAGRTVAVVGLGAIGAEIAWRLAGLGLRVIGVRRTPADAAAIPPGVAELRHPDDLLAVAAGCDALVAAVPGTPANADLFGAAVFAALPKGAVFVNVGRGSSVDEEALLAALVSGQLRGAAIDVAKHEPLDADDPLWTAPNLQISPHSSASLEGYMEGVWELFCDNLERRLAGRPMRNVVDVADVYGVVER